MKRRVLVSLVVFFFGFVLIPGFAVADKPEGAGKPEWVDSQKIEKEKEKAERKAEKEKEKAEREAEKEEERAEREAEKEKEKAERDVEDSADEDQ